MQEAQVAVKDYSSFIADIGAAAGAGKSVWLDASKVSFAVFNAAKQAAVPAAGEQFGLCGPPVFAACT